MWQYLLSCLCESYLKSTSGNLADAPALSIWRKKKKKCCSGPISQITNRKTLSVSIFGWINSTWRALLYPNTNMSSSGEWAGYFFFVYKCRFEAQTRIATQPFGAKKPSIKVAPCWVLISGCLFSQPRAASGGCGTTLWGSSQSPPSSQET